MMYVESLKLLDTLHAQRERERSESIEPDDDDAADAIAEGAFRIAVFNKQPQRGSTQTTDLVATP